MEEEEQDVLFLTPSSYMKYMTGYSIRGDERFLAWILPKEGPVLAVGNELYREQMADMPVDAFHFWKDGEDPFDLTARMLKENGVTINQAAIDPNMPAGFSLKLQGVFPQSRMTDGAGLIDPLRIYKDKTEQERMEVACQKADEALRQTIGDGREWLGSA